MVGNAYDMLEMVEYKIKLLFLPLMYHWLPSLVKNLAPLAEMVGIAVATEAHSRVRSASMLAGFFETPQ